MTGWPGSQGALRLLAKDARQVTGLQEHHQDNPAGHQDGVQSKQARKPQPLPEDRFALASDMARDPHRVPLGRIDHPPARLVEAIEDREAGRLVGALPVDGRPVLGQHAAVHRQRILMALAFTVLGVVVVVTALLGVAGYLIDRSGR